MKQLSFLGIVFGIILGAIYNFATEELWFFIPYFNTIITCTFIIAGAILLISHNDFLCGALFGMTGTIALFLGNDIGAHITGGIVFLLSCMGILLLRRIIWGRKSI